MHSSDHPARAEGGRRAAAFLDRDGTLLRERHYLADPADLELLPGAVEALALLRDAGYALILVTNQSGIARGLYTERDFEAVQSELVRQLGEGGIALDGVYHCPHHPEFTGDCECRKPATGLFLRAAAEHGLDPARSIYIGDRLKDVLPAVELGGLPVLVRTGYGAEQEAAAPDGVVVFDNVLDAGRYITGLQRVDTPRSAK